MSPSRSGLSLGMPWQTMWLTEVQHGIGVAAIHQGRREGAVVEGEFAHQPVDHLGRGARLDVLDQHVEALGGQPPGAAHAAEVLRPVQLDLFGAAAFRGRGVDVGHRPNLGMRSA